MDNGLDPFPSTNHQIAGQKTGRRSVKRGKRKTGPPAPAPLPNSESPSEPFSQSTSTGTPSSGKRKSESALAPKNVKKTDNSVKSSSQKKYDRRRKLISSAKKMQGLTPEQAEIRRLRDNENERRRQHLMSAALQELSELLPSHIQTGFKKNSRHHILDATLQYIRDMASMVDDFNLKVKRGEVPPPPNIENLDLETDALEKAKREADSVRMRLRPQIRIDLEPEDDEDIADRPYPARPMMPSNLMNVCHDTENTLEVPQCVLGPQMEGREPAPFSVNEPSTEPSLAVHHNTVAAAEPNMGYAMTAPQPFMSVPMAPPAHCGYPAYSSNLLYGPNPFLAPCPTTDNTTLKHSYPQVADFRAQHDHFAIPALPALTASLEQPNFAFSSTPKVPYVQSAQSPHYNHPAAGRYPCQPAMVQYLSEPAIAQCPSQPTTAQYPSQQATVIYPCQSYPSFEQAMPQQNGNCPTYPEPIEGAMLPPQQYGSSLLFQGVDFGYCSRDLRRVSNESGYKSVSPPYSTEQSPASLTPNSSPTHQGNMASFPCANPNLNQLQSSLGPVNINAGNDRSTNEDLCSLAEFAANNSLSWP